MAGEALQRQQRIGGKRLYNVIRHTVRKRGERAKVF